MNKYDKYAEKIHQKYISKVQYMIDVMDTCVTEEQVEACCSWAAMVFKMWGRYEDRILDTQHGGWTVINMSSRMNRELCKMVDFFGCARDRKRKELSEKEEN